MNSDIYPHASFSGPMPPFNASGANPYDMITMPNGKVSPVIPSEPVLHHHGAFPPAAVANDYPTPPFNDMHDRRLPGVTSTGYHSEYPDDYAMGSINNNGANVPFASSPMQQFSDRLGRFVPDRYNHQGIPSPNVAHIANNQGPELMRGVPPHATHSYRDSNIATYDEMHYLGNSHPPEIRMNTVDDSLSRIKSQGTPIIGTAGDLPSFIR